MSSSDLDPVRLYHALAPLRHVRRFARYPLAQPQNVAEHSYYAALLAGCFAEQLQRRGVPIDRGAVIEGALWHDAAEAMTGDIPHDFKRWRHAPELFDVWERAEQRVLERLGQFNGGLPVALQVPSLEHVVIKLADWVELLLYVQAEAGLGNHTLDFAAERIWKLLDQHLTVIFARQYPVALTWYADCLEYLRQQVPPSAGTTAGTKRHDPLSILEGGDDL